MSDSLKFAQISRKIIDDPSFFSCSSFPKMFRFQNQQFSESSLLYNILITVATDKIARAFNISGADRAVALDISKAFNRVQYFLIFQKRKSEEISGQVFNLVSLFLNNRMFHAVLNRKPSQECPLMLEFHQKASFPGPTLDANKKVLAYFFPAS